uniref:Uncharacterized protein n=1 Tax=Castor canadensis TaxID=51338 RepID=A0A8C0ZWQ5_CASCN
AQGAAGAAQSHGGLAAQWRQGPLGRATPCGACADSPAARRSRRQCGCGADGAARARPVSEGPSPCGPRPCPCRSRRATGQVRLRNAGAGQRPGGKIRVGSSMTAVAGCRTQGCEPG